jgi:hypothetical protein
MRRVAAGLAGGAAMLAATLAATLAMAADALSVKAFFGTYQGGGVAENRDSVYFSTTARDFDVTIGPAGEGFRIAWTSVLRRGGTPEKPEARRNSATRTLSPAGRPGVYRCDDSGDPLAGDRALCWARIHGRTLSMYLMAVNEDGVYELQQYDRTLSGSGMTLVFKSMRDGDELRTVTGQLVKTAK